MNLALSDEQEIIKRTARNFLAKECPTSLTREIEEDKKEFSPDIWRKMADMGWLGLVFPSEYGGSEGNFIDLAVLLEEMGRACAPSWFFSTVILGAQTVLAMGNEEQKERILPAVNSGKSLGTMAIIEPQAGYDPADIRMTSRREADAFFLDGVKICVPDAHIADWLVCVTRGKGGGGIPGTELFLVDIKTPGMSLTPLKTISGEKLHEVSFDNVKVLARNILGGGEQSMEDLEKVLQQAALAKCAEMVGGAQKVMEMTVDYAKQRVQFGRPIGSFQAIQHHCANMLVDLDCSRYLTYYAAWMLSEGIPCEKEIAMAKAYTSDAYINITILGQEIHGGTGLIKEHDMQIYFRRAKAAALSLGNATFQRKIVASEMGL